MAMMSLDLTNQSLKRLSGCYSNDVVREKWRVQTLLLDNNSLNKLTDEELGEFVALQHLSLANNHLVEIRPLAKLTHLVVVNLAGNSLCRLDNLRELSRLAWLNVADNQLQSLEFLADNERLEHLDASENCIDQLPDLSKLRALTHLNLNGNEIVSLTDAERCLPFATRTLFIASNAIHDLRQLRHLASLENLRSLRIDNNPCTSCERLFDYRPYATSCCLGLDNLDGLRVSQSEYLKAKFICADEKRKELPSDTDTDVFLFLDYLSRMCPIVENGDHGASDDQHLHSQTFRATRTISSTSSMTSSSSSSTSAATYNDVDPLDNESTLKMTTASLSSLCDSKQQEHEQEQHTLSAMSTAKSNANSTHASHHHHFINDNDNRPIKPLDADTIQKLIEMPTFDDELTTISASHRMAASSSSHANQRRQRSKTFDASSASTATSAATATATTTATVVTKLATKSPRLPLNNNNNNNNSTSNATASNNSSNPKKMTRRQTSVNCPNFRPSPSSLASNRHLVNHNTQSNSHTSASKAAPTKTPTAAAAATTVKSPQKCQQLKLANKLSYNAERYSPRRSNSETLSANRGQIHSPIVAPKRSVHQQQQQQINQSHAETRREADEPLTSRVSHAPDSDFRALLNEQRQRKRELRELREKTLNEVRAARIDEQQHHQQQLKQHERHQLHTSLDEKNDMSATLLLESDQTFEERCAIKIQTAWRAYCVRRRLVDVKDPPTTTSTTKMPVQCASLLQSASQLRTCLSEIRHDHCQLARFAQDNFDRLLSMMSLSADRDTTQSQELVVENAALRNELDQLRTKCTQIEQRLRGNISLMKFQVQLDSIDAAVETEGGHEVDGNETDDDASMDKSASLVSSPSSSSVLHRNVLTSATTTALDTFVHPPLNVRLQRKKSGAIALKWDHNQANATTPINAYNIYINSELCGKMKPEELVARINGIEELGEYVIHMRSERERVESIDSNSVVLRLKSKEHAASAATSQAEQATHTIDNEAMRHSGHEEHTREGEDEHEQANRDDSEDNSDDDDGGDEEDSTTNSSSNSGSGSNTEATSSKIIDDDCDEQANDRLVSQRAGLPSFSSFSSMASSGSTASLAQASPPIANEFYQHQ